MRYAGNGAVPRTWFSTSRWIGDRRHYSGCAKPALATGIQAGDEEAREETLAGHSLAPLDQLSAARGDDLERDADLLGVSALREAAAERVARAAHQQPSRRGDGAALLLHVAVSDQRSPLRSLHAHLGGMARAGAEPQFVSRGVAGPAPRPAHSQRSAATAKIQRRAADLVHRRDPDGPRIDRHRPRDLQAGAVRVAELDVLRLPGRALRAFRAHGRLRPLLPRARGAGDSRGMEQLPRDGDRSRSHRGERMSDDVELELKRRTRRGFLTAALAAGAGYASWKWLRTRPRIDGVEWPLRRMLEANESLANAYFSTARLSPNFHPSDITRARINGRLGLQSPLD